MMGIMKTVRRARFFMMAALALSLSSCILQTIDLEVRITSGYVTRDPGDVIHMEVEYYQDGVPYVTAEGWEPHIDPADAVLSIGEYGSMGSSYYDYASEDEVEISGTVVADDGAELAALIDTSVKLEEFWSSPVFGTVYYYDWSPSQESSVPVRNQFYVKPPQYDSSEYYIRLKLDEYLTSYIAVGYSTPRRFDVSSELVQYIGHPVAVEVVSRENETTRYLLSDGSLVNEPTSFDPAISFQPGGFLDLSGISIP